MARRDKGHRGDASQYFVAGELSRRGMVAAITLGNCPNTDLLVSNSEGTKFAHIQVKTFIPGSRAVAVGKKAENNYGDNFFWVLAGIPDPTTDKPFIYFIVPSGEMSKNVAECHKIWWGAPGRGNRTREKDTSFRNIILPPCIELNGWSLQSFENNWDSIRQRVAA